MLFNFKEGRLTEAVT